MRLRVGRSGNEAECWPGYCDKVLLYHSEFNVNFRCICT